jgi:hypothetical protein
MIVSISILTHEILYNPDRCFILRSTGRLTTLLHRASSPSKTSEQTSNPSRGKASIDSFYTQLTFHLPSAFVLLQPSLPKHRTRFTPKHQAHTTHHTTQNNSKNVEQPRAQQPNPQWCEYAQPLPFPLTHFQSTFRPVRQLGPISQPRRTYLA